MTIGIVGEYLQDFLSSEGYRVSIVNDPTIALEELRQAEYHVVVLDIMMPKLNGIDLLERSARSDDDIAVIILTGYPSLETATSSITHDVSAYIRKPFTISEFRDAILRIAKKKGLVLRREDELTPPSGAASRELRKSRGLTLKQHHAGPTCRCYCCRRSSVPSRRHRCRRCSRWRPRSTCASPICSAISWLTIAFATCSAGLSDPGEPGRTRSRSITRHGGL